MGGRFDRVTALPTAGAYSAAAGDVNSDGWPDLAFACYTDGSTYSVPSMVFRGTQDGPDPQSPLLLPTTGAYAACAGDLDGDAYPELIITGYTTGYGVEASSLVFRGGPDGLSPIPAVRIRAPGAHGCSISDLNDDGWNDLAIACSIGPEGYSTSSLILFGPDFEPGDALRLPSEGADGIAATGAVSSCPSSSLSRWGSIQVVVEGGALVLRAEAWPSGEARAELAWTEPPWVAALLDAEEGMSCIATADEPPACSSLRLPRLSTSQRAGALFWGRSLRICTGER